MKTMLWWLTLGAMLLSLDACAQGGQMSGSGESTEPQWREFKSQVDGKQLVLRFPVDTRSETRFHFDPYPVPDRYTKNIDIIGMQVGLDVGWQKVSTAFTLSFGLAPARSDAVGRARSAKELAEALNGDIRDRARKADRVTATVSEQEVIRVGGREWVRFRFVNSDGGRLPAWDDYYGIWDTNYLLSLQIRYGSKVSGDPAAIVRLQRMGEEVLASLRIE